MKELLLFLSGASATGKTTMARKLGFYLETNYHIGARIPVPYTTRPMRTGEQQGIDYWFIEEDRYKELFEPQILRNPEDWDIGSYGNYVYFNKIANTIPNKESPLSILPIHPAFYEEMRLFYLSRGVPSRNIFFEVSGATLEPWIVNFQNKRPTRTFEKEAPFLDRRCLSNSGIEILSLSWNLEHDFNSLIDIVSTIIEP